VKVAIFGFGLIGASLACALKQFNNKTRTDKYKILAIARRKKSLDMALKFNMADEVSLSLDDAASCDIIVIATPVDLTAPVYKKLCAIVKSDAIITDVGSVKYKLETEISKIVKRSKKPLPHFVSCHPMSGKESNGLEHASSDLFVGANVVMTGAIGSNARSAAPRKIISQMWQDTGAKVIKMSAACHDNFVALTSHLPHLMAFALNKIYKDKRAKDKQIDSILAGSFYSAIRVASSSADMWAPIFEDNVKNVRANLKAFIKELEVLQDALSDKEKMKQEILKTQK
jgi:prephenate dehydrogenase